MKLHHVEEILYRIVLQSYNWYKYFQRSNIKRKGKTCNSYPTKQINYKTKSFRHQHDSVQLVNTTIDCKLLTTYINISGKIILA